jgi:hypothetical protein
MKCSFLRRGKAAASIAVAVGAIAMAGALPASAATSSHPAAQAAARPAAASWANTVVLVNCRHHGVVTPRTYILSCADANDYLASLRWVSWRSVAYGSGVEHINTCVPNCAAGHFHRFPVLVTAWRAKPRGHSQWKLTRVTVIYTRNRPLRFTAQGKRHHPLTYTWRV